MSFGERLKKIREKRGLSTRELAKIIGNISASYISDIENNRHEPSLKKLRMIARGLNVDMSYLLDLYQKSKDEEQIQNDPDKREIYSMIAREELTNEDIKDIKNFIDYIITKKSSRKPTNYAIAKL